MTLRASPVCAALAAGLIATLSGIASASADPAGSPSPTNMAVPENTVGADDIRDIRGPKALFPMALLLELLAAGILLAATGYAVWRIRQRRRSRALQYFEITLRDLEKLRSLMHPSTVREFSSAISDTVRRYIEAGFKVTATHQTTEEFLHGILKDSKSSLVRHRALLDEFLQQCDLAKFAGLSLSRDNMEVLYQSARSFVVGTAPAA